MTYDDDSSSDELIKAITCPECGAVAALIIGLPVALTFSATAVATLATDTCELHLFSAGDVSLPHEEGCSEAEDLDGVHGALMVSMNEPLRILARRAGILAAPAVDVSL